MQTRWELLGLDNVLKSSDLSVSVKGALYPDRRGAQSRIKNQFELNLSFLLPPTLAFVPEDVSRGIGVSVRPYSKLLSIHISLLVLYVYIYTISM